MKRMGRVLEAVGTRANVVLAFVNTARGRRGRAETRAFEADFDQHIHRLTGALAGGTWMPAGYRRFTVHDPKERIIHAAPFADRVAHHALMNVAGPWLERGASFHSYACRRGKGNLAAVRHAERLTRTHRHFLKLDVRKYFDTVSHDVLAGLLRRQFKDGGFLALMERLVSSYETSPGCGLPIGTLVSQHLANFYLDGLDHFLTERMKCRHHVRYMDDVVLWHDDCARLTDWHLAVTRWLADERGLALKPGSEPRRTADGVPFLGYRITPRGVLLGAAARHRFRRRLSALEAAHDAGTLTDGELQRRSDALLAFVRVAQCLTWRQRLLTGTLRRPDRPGAWCVAARGTTTPAAAAPPAGSGSTPATAGTASACAWPQVRSSGRRSRRRGAPSEDRPGGAGAERAGRRPRPMEGLNRARGAIRGTFHSPDRTFESHERHGLHFPTSRRLPPLRSDLGGGFWRR